MHYTDAQVYLQDKQWTPERIKALPVAQAVLLYQVHQYLDMRDQMLCWSLIPYAESYPHLKEAERKLSKFYGRGEKYFIIRGSQVRSIGALTLKGG